MKAGQGLLANPLHHHVFWWNWKRPPRPPLLSTLEINKKRKRSAVSITTTSELLAEIRVCTNRTCRRQGSIGTLEILTDLAPANVAVKSCGCLGRCGAGPNVALLPQGMIVGHCSTPAGAAQLMWEEASDKGTEESDNAIRTTLDALALRKRAQVELAQANFSQAELLLSQGIGLKPFGGIHIMYKDRSVVRLGMGNYSGALEDAREALTIAPRYTEAFMCEGDVFMALEDYDAAEKSYSMCLRIDPSVCRSKSFKSRVAILNEKLITATTNQSAS